MCICSVVSIRNVSLTIAGSVFGYGGASGAGSALDKSMRNAASRDLILVSSSCSVIVRFPFLFAIPRLRAPSPDFGHVRAVRAARDSSFASSLACFRARELVPVARRCSCGYVWDKVQRDIALKLGIRIRLLEFEILKLKSRKRIHRKG
jgi:hypothetical protein